MSEGIPSPDGFSRLLRKLAKEDLLFESFSACARSYFRLSVHQRILSIAKSIPYASTPRMVYRYPVVFKDVTTVSEQMEEEAARQDSEIRRDQAVPCEAVDGNRRVRHPQNVGLR